MLGVGFRQITFMFKVYNSLMVNKEDVDVIFEIFDFSKKVTFATADEVEWFSDQVKIKIPKNDRMNSLLNSQDVNHKKITIQIKNDSLINESSFRQTFRRKKILV